MQFKVTQIEFDFDDSLYPMTEQEMCEVYDEYIGTLWEANDGDDLVEDITCASGWCIKSIDYVHQLVWNVSSVRYVGINKNVKINILVFSTESVNVVENVS